MIGRFRNVRRRPRIGSGLKIRRCQRRRLLGPEALSRHQFLRGCSHQRNIPAKRCFLGHRRKVCSVEIDDSGYRQYKTVGKGRNTPPQKHRLLRFIPVALQSRLNRYFSTTRTGQPLQSRTRQTLSAVPSCQRCLMRLTPWRPGLHPASRSSPFWQNRELAISQKTLHIDSRKIKSPWLPVRNHGLWTRSTLASCRLPMLRVASAIHDFDN